MTGRASRPTGLRVAAVGTGTQSQLVDVSASIGPRASDWMPDVLQQMLPLTSNLTRQALAQRDDVDLEAKRSGAFTRDVLDDLGHLDVVDDRVDYQHAPERTVPVETYVGDVSRYALRHDRNASGPPQYRVTQWARDAEDLETRLTSFLNGQTAYWNANLDVLRDAPIAYHAYLCDVLDEPPITLRLRLDGSAWIDVPDQRTAATSLEAIAALSEAFDVALVISPRLRLSLRKHHDDWFDEHLEGAIDLTERRTASLPGAPGNGSPNDADQEGVAIAVEALTSDLLDDAGGRARIVKNVPAAGADRLREQRMLKDDPEIGLEAGSIDRYVRELEDASLVEVGRGHGKYNKLRRTPAGDLVATHIDAEYGIRHPSQTSLSMDLTPTFHRTASTVYPPRRGREGVGGQAAAAAVDVEAHLAKTGDADERDVPFTQWLSGPDEAHCGPMDAYGVHERLRAAERVSGVTLVDHPVEQFDDSRVAYLSAFDDNVQAVAQIRADPILTLAGLINALLSPLALSKLIGADRVGDAFELLYEELPEEDVHEAMVNGSQIGWCSDDESEYGDWRDRAKVVRNRACRQAFQQAGSTNWEERKGIFEDLHGMLASITMLYHLAELDLTIHLRIPDTASLMDDDYLYDNFLTFIGKTVPKHAAYGIHSGWRQILEHRSEKLKRRLPIAYDETEPTADLTASWVITGPDATEMQQHIEMALAKEQANVREQVRDGDEVAPALEIPVVKGSGYAAMRSVLREFAGRKGFTTSPEDVDVAGTARERRDLERVERLLVGALSSSGKPANVSPFDVAEVCLHLASTDRSRTLTVRDIEYGLVQLPDDRLFPTLTPSETAIVRTLLLADNPLGMTEICELAGISESSYNRYMGREGGGLGAVGLVEPRRVDGRRKWTASLEPWWSPLIDVEDDRIEALLQEAVDDHPATAAGIGSLRLRDVLESVVLWVDDAPWDALGWPPDVDALLEHSLATEPYLPFICALFGTTPSTIRRDGHETGNGRLAVTLAMDGKPPDGGVAGCGKEPVAGCDKVSSNGAVDSEIAAPSLETRTVLIGALPACAESEQMSIAEIGEDVAPF